MDRLSQWILGLLVFGGLMLGIPQLYRYLAFGGAPWVAVVVGWASVVVAVVYGVRTLKK